jgi:transcriptional regulator with XRE-family HTH domain
VTAADIPAEALLIRRARMARRMSPEDAAPLAGVIKSRRWRQIEQGHPASDEVLAHMAAVTGVDPEQLEQAGRKEAAEILREIRRQESQHIPGLPPGVDPAAFPADKWRALIEAARILTAALDEVERGEGRRGA